MPKLKIAPTRSNLLKTKYALTLAQDGHDLLEQKREVLFIELMQIIHRLRDLEEEMAKKSALAFSALESAILSMGQEAVEWSALSVLGERTVDIIHRSVMGVPVVNLKEVKESFFGLQASMVGTNPALDEARKRFEELIEVICAWSEVEISVWRLANEIKKTQRRVNALENIFIPEYKQTVKAIDEVLEEGDREEFIRKKKVKSFLAKKRALEQSSSH
ncbi:TPA: V-type ATP synthase subunit D [Candidatus Poribacteria bacterium]|nr:V-type ATP synthase subunit D [Candidatus Poribacteria bacterium]